MWNLNTWECVKTIDADGYVRAMIMFDDKLISTSSEKIKVLLLLLHLNQVVTSTSNQSGAGKKHRQNTIISAMRIIDSFLTFPCVQVPDFTNYSLSSSALFVYLFTLIELSPDPEANFPSLIRHRDQMEPVCPLSVFKQFPFSMSQICKILPN